ncbi:MAG TPA: hypothetical protein VM260_03565 [Pirellula sp.]|nr:hypothetical protein [Pirellula sp.]
MRNPFVHAHNNPGRRFAHGSTKHDHILGAFGFVAHMFTFLFVGSLLSHEVLTWIAGIAAAILLAIRAYQVGGSTTKESLQAIKDAWL